MVSHMHTQHKQLPDSYLKFVLMDSCSIEVIINLSKWSTALFSSLTFVLLFLQRAKMSDFDRYKVMKAKRMVSACLIPADHGARKMAKFCCILTNEEKTLDNDLKLHVHELLHMFPLKLII